MIRGRAARRSGFTLIELMVSIAIIALLVALVASGVQKVRYAQQAKANELLLIKLDKGLDTQYRAEVDVIKKLPEYQSPPANLLVFCDMDADRARSLVVFAQMKVRFPQTFQEACNGVPVGNFLVYPALQLFTKRITGLPPGAATVPPPATQADADFQAAALLYIILTEKSVAGVSFPADDTTSNAQTDVQYTYQVTNGNATNTVTNSFRVFRDIYGTPIRFSRSSWIELVGSPPVPNPELDTPAYSEAAGAKNKSADPLDPLGKLANWNNANNKTFAQNNVLSSTGPGVVFSVKPRFPTVISAGPNKRFENAPLGTTDDVYSYRLTRQGARGD